MKCKDIAKEFVEDETSCTSYYTDKFKSLWADKFKACEDFPRDPEVISTIVDKTQASDTFDVFELRALAGRKWRAVFTEVVE